MWKLTMPAEPLYEVEFAGARGRQIQVVAGAPGVWRWHFRCGRRPIARKGGIRLFCEVPKFWMATCLQADDPGRPGFVRVVADEGVRARLAEFAQHWKSLAWATVALPDGLERGQGLCIEFGSDRCPAYVVAHKYRRALISMCVDYAGDDRYTKLWPPMVVHVRPGPPAKLYLVCPSIVAPGERLTVRGRAEDANSNIGASLPGKVRLELDGPVERPPLEVEVRPDGTFESQGWRIEQPGTYRVRARSLAVPGLVGLSNPASCEPQGTDRVVWGDCHCHTGWADGVGTCEENLTYARDEAFLDVFGLAEHLSNAGGFTTQVVDKHGADWALFGQHVAEVTRAHDEPGRFVTILGHEYTPDERTREPSGDFCVFCPSDRWEDVPMAAEYTDLIELARQAGALVIPHVGGRTPDFAQVRIDADVTPLVEIASMHGHFEHYAQAGLARGHKLGFVGMSDGHFGMPGYDNWAQHGRTPGLKHRNYSVQSAITAFLVPELTRQAVFAAMRMRKTYATTGQRILLFFAIDDVSMGGERTCNDRPVLRIRVRGTAPIALVDIIRGDRRLHRIEGQGRLDLDVELQDPAPAAGQTYYYVRVIQEDFSLAWSSPIWVRYTGPGPAGPEQIAALPAWNAGPEWPPDRPETCSPDYDARLRKILDKRGIADRFVGIHQVGLFRENRGRFAMFRAYDTEQAVPVHIHLYVDFADDRLYIAAGLSDYGQCRQGSNW